MAWDLKEETLKKAKLQEEKNASIIAAIPEKYRHYLMYIEKGSQIAKKEMTLDNELTAVGCYVLNGKTYLPLKSAYFTVMGKVAQFNDWVAEAGYSSKISEAQFAQVGNIYSCRKTIQVFNAQGRLIKEASGTSSVGFGGSGVDATNPLENAETSALGRCLTFLGMGTQVENVASAEEMKEAEKRGMESDKPAEKEPEMMEEVFVVDEVKDYTKDGKPVAKVCVTSKDSGEQLIVWLKDILATQAKSLSKGDVIQASIAEIPGTDGKSVNTFLGFSKINEGRAA